ncbi:hypothetical protein GQ42DRAFT_129103, partial [Ramicandelaber brevisporus]
HARIALEKSDIGEFNQYNNSVDTVHIANVNEFTAYRILYCLFARAKTDIAGELANLTPRQRQQDPAIGNALAIQRALATGDHFTFFKLYKRIPNHGKYIVDQFINRERLAYLRRMCTAFRPAILVAELTQLLAMDKTTAVKKWLKELGITIGQKEKGTPYFINTIQATQALMAASDKYRVADIKGQL